MVDTYILGKSELNIDGPEKIAGRAKFAIDMTLPGMLHARVLRSPRAHALGYLSRFTLAVPRACRNLLSQSLHVA